MSRPASYDKSAGNGKPPTAWVADLFARCEVSLVTYVGRRVGNVETARDVVQEAFVKLCQQQWPDIEPHATAWLYRTCRNRAIDLTRREGRMNMVHTTTDVSTLHDQTCESPSEQVANGEQIQQVRLQLEALPEQQQELLRLRLHDGLSYKQIAEVTGISTSNVGYQLHQAISKLRMVLNPN